MGSVTAKAKKESEVNELVDKFNKAKGIVFANFTGLNSEDTADVRKRFLKANLEYKVIKNNIILRALEKVNMKDLQKFITGSTGVVLAYEDPIKPAKILKDFTVDHDKLKIVAGVMEGKMLEVKELKAIADLPSREVLIARVIGQMKAPMFSLVFVLKGGMDKLVRTLEEVKKTKK